MFRFAIKSGIAFGLVYYVNEKGTWKDSEKTTQLYEEVKKHTCPYIKQALSKLPFELPTIPKKDNVLELGKHYWNSGVKSTFRFLADSPTHFGNWGKLAYNKMVEFSKPPEAIKEEK